MKVIVLASNNAHKVQEIQSIFTEYNLDIYIISQKEFLGDNNIDIEETGSTLQENAMIKADAIYSLTGLPVLADDTGLEVSSLDFALAYIVPDMLANMAMTVQIAISF